MMPGESTAVAMDWPHGHVEHCGSYVAWACGSCAAITTTMDVPPLHERFCGMCKMPTAPASTDDIVPDRQQAMRLVRHWLGYALRCAEKSDTDGLEIAIANASYWTEKAHG